MGTLKKLLQRDDVLLAIASGVAYGVVAQLVVRLDVLGGLFAVMSFGYVFLLPIALGFVTASNLQPGRRLLATIMACWGTSALCLALAFAVGWEGTICLVMAAPLYLGLSTLGGVAGYYARRRRTGASPSQRSAYAALLLLPLLSAGVESQLPLPRELREVTSSIEIAAQPAAVWPHIARVAAIKEHPQSFFFRMGFPRPIEATLSHEGVGGVRHASFERGLMFVETITYWEPPRELRFAIAPDPDNTPLTTLDAHVMVGGRYFDVLDGRYRIEPIGADRVRLQLSSRHRISTTFNFYTSLWSDYLMSEIQQNILVVLKARCEEATRGVREAGLR